MNKTSRVRSVTGVIVAALLAACSADITTPGIERDPQVNNSLEMAAISDGNGGGNNTAAGDTVRGTIYVSPNGGNYVFGEHKINFPSGSVCDMAVTNYSDWGQPCTPISTTVRIDIKWWTDAAGHPQVDFLQALRFQPTKRGEVTLHLKDAIAAKANNPKMNYCAVVGGPCVDESVNDPTLATKKDSRGGFVYRIIRHFSGYNVWA